MSFGGGFAREDHIFKAMALCAPFTKLVCMGRAPMIPGYLGSNIEGVFKPENRQKVNGHWEQLPQSYSIPLGDFVADNPALELTRLKAVRLVFDRAPAGEVVVDQIGFSALDPGFLSARVDGPRR